MRQSVADGGLILAPGAEFGPIAADRLLIINQAAFSLDMQRSGRNRFCDREDWEEPIAVNFAYGRFIGQATPYIGYQFSIHISCDLNSDLASTQRSLNCSLNGFVDVDHFCHQMMFTVAGVWRYAGSRRTVPGSAPV